LAETIAGMTKQEYMRQYMREYGARQYVKDAKNKYRREHYVAKCYTKPCANCGCEFQTNIKRVPYCTRCKSWFKK
jgi:predicted Zn-ribbon and HTH transcriptional regulator